MSGQQIGYASAVCIVEVTEAIVIVVVITVAAAVVDVIAHGGHERKCRVRGIDTFRGQIGDFPA